MKPEDIDKALKLRDAYNQAQEQLSELNGTDKLKVSYFNRNVVIHKEDPKFISIHIAMTEFLNLRINSIVREGNQIGLSLESAVEY